MTKKCQHLLTYFGVKNTKSGLSSVIDIFAQFDDFITQFDTCFSKIAEKEKADAKNANKVSKVEFSSFLVHSIHSQIDCISLSLYISTSLRKKKCPHARAHVHQHGGQEFAEWVAGESQNS